MPLSRDTITIALAQAGIALGHDLKLGPKDAVGLVIDGAEIVVEWIEPSRCAAVHTRLELPNVLVGPDLALLLMQAHLAGASTHGCTFWLAPDNSVRVGALLLGPSCGPDELIEALQRVMTISTGDTRGFISPTED